MKKIINELSRIQQGLKAPKNKYNKFGNYYYRNAEGILEAVKPLLNGLALIINDEPIAIGGRFYIKATATLTDGEEQVSATAYAREDQEKKGMDGAQITGACSSYARKYALNALLMIDDTKDSDDDQISPKNPNGGLNPEEPKAKVTTSATVPQTAQNGPSGASTAAGGQTGQQQPQTAPAVKKMGEGAAFLVNAKAQLERDIPGFDFGKARAELVASGEVENVPSAVITLDQASALISKMYEKYGKKAG